MHIIRASAYEHFDGLEGRILAAMHINGISIQELRWACSGKPLSCMGGPCGVRP